MMAFTADDAFNAFVYPDKHPSGIQFLKDQFTNFTGVLTNTANNFIQESQQLVDRFTGSAAIDFARNIVKGVFGTNKVNTDLIVNLWEVDQLQGASINMQRWVMANPLVRDFYHNQRCDGYSDTYFDVEPGFVKEDHYDYRRVMDGVMQYKEDGSWYVKCYLEELREDDRDLTHGEKMDIIQTWTKLDYLMTLNKEDPTNPEGGSL